LVNMIRIKQKCITHEYLVDDKQHLDQDIYFRSRYIEKRKKEANNVLYPTQERWVIIPSWKYDTYNTTWVRKGTTLLNESKTINKQF
jgi:GTP cyclohydrolase II